MSDLGNWVDYQSRECSTHGLQMGSVYRCYECGGDGEVEALNWEGWFDGDYEPCEVCDGVGFWWVCSKCAVEEKAA